MDITIQMRSLELLIKMLKRDMRAYPPTATRVRWGAFPFCPQGNPCLAAPLRRRAFPAR